MVLFVQSVGLIELAPPLELGCSGLGRIEFVGGGLGCFVLYRNAIAIDSGRPERVACARVYAPLEAIPEALDLMLGALIETGMAHTARLSKRFQA